MDGCGMLMEGQDSHDRLPALQAVKGIPIQLRFLTALCLIFNTGWSYSVKHMLNIMHFTLHCSSV